MILETWPHSVNDNFYSMSKKPKENTETAEFTSGRVVSWQKNTKKQMTYSAKLMLKTDSELEDFYNWFNDELGQTAGIFTCSAIGDAYYRFTSVPAQEDTDQNETVINLEFEEAI